MRVLWLTNTPPPAVSDKVKYNGGGWVSSLGDALAGKVELGVAFISGTHDSPSVYGGIKFFPVYDRYDRSRGDRIRKLLLGNHVETSWLIASLAGVVREFRPDVVEVFGSERMYGLIADKVNVPVVLHIQGILEECRKSFIPPGMSMLQYYMSGRSVAGIFGKYYYASSFRRRCRQERRIFRMVSHYIGRTAWDRDYLRRVNPDAEYFHLDEILRNPFYDNAGKWNARHGSVPEIVTTISEAPFKGMDVVLRTADILRNRMGIDFVWKVYGNVDVGLFEKLTGISAEKSGVVLMGVASAGQLADALMTAAAYVHPSYVENSPNSLCEAQMIGVPCVAADTGGIPSIIDNGITGVLVRKGDSEAFAGAVARILGSLDFASRLGAASARAASLRHDRGVIVTGLLSIYRNLIEKTKELA